MQSTSIMRSSATERRKAFCTLYPRIKRHAEISFRSVTCPQFRDDLVAEVIALAWKWFGCLAERGRDAAKFPMALAQYATRAVRSGRCCCGQSRAKDVLSRTVQRRYGFQVENLPSSTRRTFEDVYGEVNGQRRMDAFEEKLHYNIASPIPDQVAFRCDFPKWLRTRTSRDRQIIDDMMRDETNVILATKYGVSTSRISQLRSDYMRDWDVFCAEPDPRPVNKFTRSRNRGADGGCGDHLSVISSQ